MSNLTADSIRQQEDLSEGSLKNKKVLVDADNTIVSSTTTGPTLEQEIKSNEPLEVINLEKEREEAPQTILQKASEGTAAVLQAAGDTIGQVAGTAKDMAVSATEKLSHVYSDTLQPAAAVVGEKLSDAAHLAVDKVVEAKDALTAPETTEKVSHIVQDTKDMIVSAAVVTKDTVVESAHVVGNVADKIYHWVADAVVPQMKDQVEAVTETATNALATTAEFVTTHVGEVKEKAKELISGGEVEKKVEEVKEDLKPAEESGEKQDLKEEPIKQKESVKDIAKSSGLEASSGKRDDGLEPSPLINMEVFPKGNIPTTKTRTMVGSTITRESEFGKYLQRYEIIPSVFANYFDDTYHFDLEFGANTFSGHINREPYLFAPGQVASQPNIYLKKQMKGGINVPSLSNFLGLAMVDVDFWSKDLKIGDKKEFVHWLVMNIPAANITNSFRIPVEQGQELVSFMPSQPEEGTGIHKYMFFLFEYDHKMNFDTFDRMLDSKDLEKRANSDFRIERFSNDYNIGSPVGFFMYQCKNENE